MEGKLGAKDGRVKLLIRGEGGLGIFQIPFWDPRVFFGGVSLPSDQEGAGCRGSAVAYNFLNFVFFFPVDKVRGWHREVLAVDLVFAIRRKKRSMEDRVDLPGFWELELVYDRQ